MATNYFEPKATAVAQLTTVTVGGTLSGETFTISVNGVDIASHTDADTVIATTVADLVSDWNASTHPYATGITAADTSPSLTLTGDTAGVPFTVTLNTPGGAATFNQAETTSATGPNHYNEANNWSEDAVPGAGDNVRVENSDVNICWGLDASATDISSFTVMRSYTGRIGLDPQVFATSSDGETTVSTATEYRQAYLKLDCDRIEVGVDNGVGNPAGSQLISIGNAETTATNCIVHGTATTAWRAGEYAFRYWTNDADADIEVKSAPGGVVLGPDTVNGTAGVIGDVIVSDMSATSKVVCNERLTISNFTAYGGSNILRSSGTVTACKIFGGVTTSEGDFTITTYTIEDGTFYQNHIKTGGSEITTANLNGGTTDATRSAEARTWDTVTPKPGATLIADADTLTITTLNDPASGPWKAVFSDP